MTRKEWAIPPIRCEATDHQMRAGAQSTGAQIRYRPIVATANATWDARTRMNCVPLTAIIPTPWTNDLLFCACADQFVAMPLLAERKCIEWDCHLPSGKQPVAQDDDAKVPLNSSPGPLRS